MLWFMYEREIGRDSRLLLSKLITEKIADLDIRLYIGKGKEISNNLQETILCKFSRIHNLFDTIQSDIISNYIITEIIYIIL